MRDNQVNANSVKFRGKNFDPSYQKILNPKNHYCSCLQGTPIQQMGKLETLARAIKSLTPAYEACGKLNIPLAMLLVVMVKYQGFLEFI